MLLAFTAVAQRNYVPGIVITNQHDSLNGYIDYRNWNISPDKISFKRTLESTEEQSFTPEGILGFKISGQDELYVSRKLAIDITDQRINALEASKERTIQDTAVFLVRLVNGIYSLYAYTDKFTREHYFYDGKEEGMRELIYSKAYVTNDHGSGLYENKSYQALLTVIFQDCPEVARNGGKVTYREQNLRNLFLAYNHCKNPSSVNEEVIVKKRTTNKIWFGIMGGASFNSYHFKGPSAWSMAKYDGSVNPFAGVWLDIPTSRGMREFSVVTELLYRSTTAKGTMSNGNQVKFGFSYAQVNLLLQYTYPKGMVKPFGNIGLGNGFIVKTSDNKMSTMPNVWREVIDGPRSHEQAFLAGAGVKVSKFKAELRYSIGNGFSPYTATKTSIRSIQAVLGYHF
jgi:hypothetical protein